MAGVQESQGTAHEVREDGYYGYCPISPRDYPYEEDELLNEREDDGIREKNDHSLLRDIGRTSRVLLICMAFFAFSFVVFLAWSILIGSCKAKRFCDIIDRSALGNDRGNFRPFRFLIPSKLVWLGLLLSSSGLFISAWKSFGIVKENVGTPTLAILGSKLRLDSHRFLRLELAVFATAIPICFLLFGLGIGWRIAGAFADGAIIAVVSILTPFFSSLLATTRITAASELTFRQTLKLAMRSGSVVSLLVCSLALAGSSLVYILFEDVRGIAGFAVGSSFLALVLRTGGSIFSKSSCLSGRIVQRLIRGIPESSFRNPATAGTCGGFISGELVASAADYFETAVSSILAASFLGTSLPFFHRDQYAMCVYNHLSIDKKCGPFGYLNKKFSYAQYICTSDKLYLSYPRLSVWQSTSVFVALPFVLFAAGLVITLTVTAYLRCGPQLRDSENHSDRVRKLRESWRMNALLTTVLAICGSAAVCFSLFGDHSIFQAAAGLGVERNLKFYKISEEANACVNEYISRENGSSPVVLPKGSFELGHFRPVSSTGLSFGIAKNVPWRLFGCCLIGIAFSQLLVLSSSHFVSDFRSSVVDVIYSGSHGAVPALLDGISSSLISTGPLMTLVLVCSIGSYYLFGSYGLAVTSVATSMITGLSLSAEAIGAIVRSGCTLARLTRPLLSSSGREVLSVLDDVWKREADLAKVSSHGTSCLTALAVLAAILETSGLTPFPTELVGTPRVPGSRLLNDNTATSFTDLYISACLLLGFAFPFLLSGLLLLSTSRVTRWVTVVTSSHCRSAREMTAGDTRLHEQHAIALQALGRFSLEESVLPCTFAIAMPLTVGFGLGKRALLAWLCGVVASAFMLGAFCTILGSTYRSSLTLLEGGAFGEDSEKGSNWYKAVAFGSMIGGTLRDTAGSALNGLMKQVTVLSLLVVYLMQNGPERGWIGAILLILLALFVTVYSVFSRIRVKKRMDTLGGDIGNECVDFDERAPPKVVSPFYMAKALWSAENVVPGSQMHEAMQASGIETGLFDPTRLPGLRDDESCEIQIV